MSLSNFVNSFSQNREGGCDYLSPTDEETEIPAADVAELGSRVHLWSPCLNCLQSH